MKQIPWGEIRQIYESGGTSYRKLAKEYGVSPATICAKAKRENWRGRWGDQIPDTTDDCLASAVRQLSLLLHRAETGEAVSMTEVKELTAVLKELVRLKSAMSESSEGTDVLHVVLDDEVKAWSK